MEGVQELFDSRALTNVLLLLILIIVAKTGGHILQIKRQVRLFYIEHFRASLTKEDIYG